MTPSPVATHTKSGMPRRSKGSKHGVRIFIFSCQILFCRARLFSSSSLIVFLKNMEGASDKGSPKHRVAGSPGRRVAGYRRRVQNPISKRLEMEFGRVKGPSSCHQIGGVSSCVRDAQAVGSHFQLSCFPSACMLSLTLHILT